MYSIILGRKGDLGKMEWSRYAPNSKMLGYGFMFNKLMTYLLYYLNYL